MARIEFCTNDEYIRENILDPDAFDSEAWGSEAASEWTETFSRKVDDLGHEAEQAQGQRKLFHGWNGANTFTHTGQGWGTFDDLTPEQIKAIDQAATESAAAVESNPHWQ